MPSISKSACPTRHARDLKLAGRAAAGESLALETIMREHNRLLFRCARGIVADDASAQDIVQDAYLRAFTALDGFRGECALGTWLARIAIRLALDHQRQRARLVNLDTAAEQYSGTPMESPMLRQVPPAEMPEALAERAQLRTILQRAIDSLPPIYRSVFMLRAVEEMSVNDTALCLQVSTDVVKTRYLRSRALLRDALGAQLEAQSAEVYAFAGARCDAVVAHVLTSLRHRQLLRDNDSG